FAGEQYALPEAVSSLREIRKLPKNGDLITISAADPLNLTGIITPGQRLSAQANQRVLYRDGIPLSISTQNKTSFIEGIESQEECL
ncbi:MAG: hypothetical protein ACXWTL_07245, partial [Methylobacter sp.]